MSQNELEKMSDGIFKRCTCCGHVWETRDGFLHDPRVDVIGYQVNFEDKKLGWLYFNHLVPGCATTIAMQMDAFENLVGSPVWEFMSKPDCSGVCLRADDRAACPSACECEWASGVLQFIRDRKSAVPIPV